MNPAWMNVMPRAGHQVGREPGDEEDLRRVAAELPEGGAQDLPLPQQRADVAPLGTGPDRPCIRRRRPPRCSRARPGSRPCSRRDCDRALHQTSPKATPKAPDDRRRARASRTAARSRTGARSGTRGRRIARTSRSRWRGPARAAGNQVARIAAVGRESRAPRRRRAPMRVRIEPLQRPGGGHERGEERPHDHGDEVGDARPEPIEEDAARDLQERRSSRRRRRRRDPAGRR